MTSKQSNFNWEKLEKKGKLEGDLRKSLTLLKTDIINRAFNNKELFCVNKRNQVSKQIKNIIEPELENLFSNFSIFNENEIKAKRKDFYTELGRNLDLLINKKACCSIKFDCFAIYNFFKALSSILDEIEIEVHQDKLYILTMDPLRIVVVEIIISNDTFNFYGDKKLGFNLNNLQNVLKCKNSDESKIELIFGKERLFITIKSKKYKSKIDRQLNCIDFHQSGRIDIEQLHDIDYDCQFELSKEKLKYLIENFGFHSQIIKIQCFPDKINFIESGDLGTNEVSWDKNSISNLFFNSEKKESELPEIDNKNHNINNQNYCWGVYSLDFFNLTYKMADLLSNSDSISFSIKESHPLKAEINFPILGNSKINFFISPRS